MAKAAKTISRRVLLSGASVLMAASAGPALARTRSELTELGIEFDAAMALKEELNRKLQVVESEVKQLPVPAPLRIAQGDAIETENGISVSMGKSKREGELYTADDVQRLRGWLDHYPDNPRISSIIDSYERYTKAVQKIENDGAYRNLETAYGKVYDRVYDLAEKIEGIPATTIVEFKIKVRAARLRGEFRNEYVPSLYDDILAA